MSDLWNSAREPRVSSRDAAHQPAGLDDRGRRRRIRLADRLLDRGLPRLPPRGDHDLRAERQTRSRPTSSSRSTWGRPSCARSRSRTSCPPTGRRSPSSRPGRAGASSRCSAPRGASTTRASRTSWPRRTSSPHKLGWNDQRYPARVGWLQRAAARTATRRTSSSSTRTRNFVGRAKHVMLACGHGPLSFPPVLAKARQDPALADRIVQAYAPKQYDPSGRYIVIGSGIASVNEWANAIDVGAKCISLDPQPDAGRAGSEHAALLLRGARDRRVPEPRLRPADRVPRPDPQGHGAAPPRLGGEDRDAAARRAASSRSSARSTRSSRARSACACT